MAMSYEKKSVSMAKLFVDGEEEEEFVILSVSGDENDDNNSDLDLSLSLWEFVDVPESDQQDQPLSDEENLPEKEDREIQSESEAEIETVEDRPQEESSLFLVQEVSDHRDEDADRDRALGLNDDLVPWNVSDKFGNQRMKKLGMRGSQKVHGPKRSSHSTTKRGGSKGKRGSGLKHGY